MKLPSGSWRAVVRRYIGETFDLREDARRWATPVVTELDRKTSIDFNPVGERGGPIRPCGDASIDIGWYVENARLAEP